MAYKQTWDLDRCFLGGSNSKPFEKFLKELEEAIRLWPSLPVDEGSFAQRIDQFQNILNRLSEADSFVECLAAQNTRDLQATRLRSMITELQAQFDILFTLLDQQLVALDEKAFEELLKLPSLQPIAFSLNERRRRVQGKMSPSLENLANLLAVDGYHGWGQIYDRLIAHISITIEVAGKKENLSVAQADNRLCHPDRATRESVFKSANEVWNQHQELFSGILNHIAGFRLKLYAERGWNSPLKEPLERNCMSEQTLDAMWKSVEMHCSILYPYLQRKAQLLGLDRLAWNDLVAPIGDSERLIPYEEGAELIVNNFHQFSPKMAVFARKALNEGWIDAEDRPNKRPGGFCTPLPCINESRIFMTYAGTILDLATLAHELGHAFHDHATFSLPPLAQKYPTNLAETASTLAEQILIDAALKTAQSEKEKLSMLDQKLQRSVLFLLNIRMRFLFETRFYEERKCGAVSAERLSALMLEIQQQLFGGLLSDYHPYFWISKLHFYITDLPFYNFPYSFGYLFSQGIYAHALAQGGAFEDSYIALLRDTGCMSTEELAKKHLGVDLTTADFWDRAMQPLKQDVDLFVNAISS